MPHDITRFRKQPCPYCGKALDSAASPDPTVRDAPRHGDFLLCFGCAQPAVAVAGPLGVGLRKPTGEELAEFAVDQGHLAERLQQFLAQHPR